MRLKCASLVFYPIPMQFTHWFRIAILAAAAVAYAAICQAGTVSDQDAARLQLVKKYADAVLRDAADCYHSQEPSPLLAGGINVYTKEHLTWVFPETADFPNGRAAVWSDFAVQQNLMRVLAALTNLTGDREVQGCRQSSVRVLFCPPAGQERPAAVGRPPLRGPSDALRHRHTRRYGGQSA